MKVYLLLAFISLALSMKTHSDSQELTIPKGLPPITWPSDNPYDYKKAELGRLLYFDTRLSSDGTISCASCHEPSEAFSDRRQIAIGIKGQKGTRHAMTIINSAYLPILFWDGRVKTLEEQCKIPIANPKEMTLYKDPHEAHLECHERVKKIRGYRLLFKEVFNSEKCNLEQIAQAIATFERTILSGNSPYDRYVQGDLEAMSPLQIEGYKIFMNKGCIDCHHGVNFSNGTFANIGIGMDSPDPDLGRYIVTKNKRDWGAFKVPGLREVANTYPYMHDGSLSTLEEVIDYYDKGGNPNPNLHRLMKPLHLKQEEKKALISFLKALSGEGWKHIKAPEHFPN